MKRIVVILGILFLSSCSSNCDECEKKLLDCALMKTIPIDLPKPTDNPSNLESSMVTIEISATNKYMLEGKEYDFEELVTSLGQALDSMQSNRVKIAADSNALYKSVFKVMAACEKNGWVPILAYN